MRKRGSSPVSPGRDIWLIAMLPLPTRDTQKRERRAEFKINPALKGKVCFSGEQGHISELASFMVETTKSSAVCAFFVKSFHKASTIALASFLVFFVNEFMGTV